MRFEITFSEEDFLAYQLFTASKSTKIKQRKRMGHALLTILAFGSSIVFFQAGNNPLSIYCLVVGIIFLVFYPFYIKWKYKKHYQSHIKEQYATRIGETDVLEFGQDAIVAKNKVGESTINISEIENIAETLAHFFVKLTNGMTFIIPVHAIENPSELRTYFTALGIEVHDEKAWKW